MMMMVIVVQYQAVLLEHQYQQQKSCILCVGKRCESVKVCESIQA